MTDKRTKNRHTVKDAIRDARKKRTEYIPGTIQLLTWAGVIEDRYNRVHSTTEIVGFSGETIKTSAINPKCPGFYTIPARPLMLDEKRVLKKVFIEFLDYDRIRIKIGDFVNIQGRSVTTGNMICLYTGDLNFDGTISDKLLIHEATHVFQYQVTLGFDYISRALIQHRKWSKTKGKYDPYNYDSQEEKGISWLKWEPEQQAQWVQNNGKLPDEVVSLLRKGKNEQFKGVYY